MGYSINFVETSDPMQSRFSAVIRDAGGFESWHYAGHFASITEALKNYADGCAVTVFVNNAKVEFNRL
jgi:hypothetical protein